MLFVCKCLIPEYGLNELCVTCLLYRALFSLSNVAEILSVLIIRSTLLPISLPVNNVMPHACNGNQCWEGGATNYQIDKGAK